MFALPRTSLDSHSKSRKSYRICATLFQIFDSNSKHVGGTSPANLDSERGWEILRERCDVYPCAPWKHGKLCRSDVFRPIPPIDTDAELTTKTRIRVLQRWRNCCFIPCASRSSRRSRDRLSALDRASIACMEISYP